MAGNSTGLQGRAAMLRRNMSAVVQTFRPAKARTLATFKEGTRTETTDMLGTQIAYWKDLAHGQSWYSPPTGSTSFRASLPQTTGAMFAGPAYRNMNFWLENHMQIDLRRGKIPDSYIKERKRRIATHMLKKNLAVINGQKGTRAVISSASGGGLMTCFADNSARGRSKGVHHLTISDATNPLYYDAVNDSTQTVVATFYVSGRPSNITAQAAGFTVGNAAALNVSGLLVVESGSYYMEMMGLADHISDAARIYQGADTAVDIFLKNPSIDAGNAAPTPTMVHAAKQVMMTRSNEDGEIPYVCHITHINLRTLAKYGYTSASSAGNQQRKADANQKITFGLPTTYVDENTVFVPDSDYEECYMDFRERTPFFEMVQKEFALQDQEASNGRHEWPGTWGAGSSEAYENYNEAVQIVWDGRGADGERSDGSGSPNSSVFIKNIAMPADAQYVVGVGY